MHCPCAKDKAQVRALAERLRADGVKVWFDDWAIPWGAVIPEEIDQGLAQSRLMLLFMSQHAFASDWVGLERASFRYPGPLNKERRFIPLRLDETTPPASLQVLKYFDWRTPDETHYQQLLALCLGKPDTTLLTPIPTVLQGALQFGDIEKAWPHDKGILKLQFANQAHTPISEAQCGAHKDDCDDFILQVTCRQPGQLALFYQSSDGYICQLFPNTHTRQNMIPAATHYLPGPLLLPCDILGPEMARLHFQDTGHESVLGLLCPQLPACLPDCTLHA